MKIEFITNASFLIQFDDGRQLLTDPWYTDGIYLGTLFNFPPLSSNQRQHYLNVRPDFIYISHYHGDHLDPSSLRHYPKQTPILIGQFATPPLRNAIRSCGFTDIRELAFELTAEFDGIEITIFSQFSAAGEDRSEEDTFPIDTSIHIRETNGPSLFFCVDNPMQVQDAADVRNRFGAPDVALLPYSGASIYPWVFKSYSHEDKLMRANSVRLSRLEKFCQLAEEIGAKYVVPAAGSFVYGGRIAEQAMYQLQATPVQIMQYLATRHLNATPFLMSTGDILDCQTGATTINHEASFRDFSDSDRVSYAASLKNFQCPIDEIVWPSNLCISWRALLRQARGNVWRCQQENSLFPQRDVDLFISSSPMIQLPVPVFHVRIPLDRDELTDVPPTFSRPFVRFHLSSALLISILLGSVFWNVAEYLMEIERWPDDFDVSTHRLMAHLRLQA